MSKSLRELLATICFAVFIWGSTFIDTLISSSFMRPQFNGGVSGISPWGILVIAVAQIGIFYVGATLMLKILHFTHDPQKIKRSIFLVTIFAWLALEKILGLPRLIAKFMPAIGDNSTVAYIGVFGSQILATYMLVLLVSRFMRQQNELDK